MFRDGPPSGRLPRQLLSLALVALLAVPGSRGLVAQEEDDPSPHSDAYLVSEHTSIQPGRPFTVALYLAMDEGWHSYWVNPGDAGMATSIEWDLPDGFVPGGIQWPHPTKIDVPPLVSYGFFEELLLPVEITPPSDLTNGSSVVLAGRADWLICVEICLPATAELYLEIPVEGRDPQVDPVWSGMFADTRAAFPQAVGEWDFEARRTSTGFDLGVAGPADRSAVVEGAYFFATDETAVAPSQPQSLSGEGTAYVLSLVESPYLTGSIPRLQGVLLAPEGLTWDSDGAVRALAVDAPVVRSAAPASAGPPAVTLVMALVFGFLGGVLLNLMPCVFPILSIKVLGFVHQGGEDPHKARAHGLAFGAGVVASFLALAGVILLIRAGGTRLGWGFQLQSPVFVAVMCVLFFVIALNLMGVFEVGTRLAGAVGRIAQPSGYADSLTSGVLATLVATPCTAPFMGSALGFALAQPSAATLAIFGMLGIGMAMPYVVLSMAPGLIDKLPQPGAWMETLKQLLAFPLFATVVWLVWVFGLQTGMAGVAYLLSTLLLVSLATWMVGRWPAPLVSRRVRVVTRTVSLAALAVGVFLLLRGAGGEAAVANDTVWEPFSTSRVEELRTSGTPVFVDFTAAWCITCQVNEQVILSSSAVRDAFRDNGVATLKADWTRFDAEITTALEGFGRSGVPLYVLYPADRASDALVLPTILSKQTVIEALESVSGAGVRAGN